MSFENLTFATTELPKIKRPRETGPNPFEGPVSQTYAEKTGKSFEVPGAQGTKAVAKLRSAASRLGLGVRIVVMDGKGKTITPAELKDLAEKKSTAKVVVMFQAQEKRKYDKK